MRRAIAEEGNTSINGAEYLATREAWIAECGDITPTAQKELEAKAKGFLRRRGMLVEETGRGRVTQVSVLEECDASD